MPSTDCLSTVTFAGSPTQSECQNQIGFCPSSPRQSRNADSERQLEIRRVDLLCLAEDGHELPTLTASEPHQAGENSAAQMDRWPNGIYVGAPH